MYLVLDSEAAWAQQFGQEPPPIEPPLNWQQEIVLAAFLGPQPSGVQFSVTSIVRRGNTVSTWLSIPAAMPAQPGENLTNLARVLVRVPRSALPTPITQAAFAFLAVNEQVLAQGPAGAVPLPTATGLVPSVPFEATPAGGETLSQSLTTVPSGVTTTRGRITGGLLWGLVGISALVVFASLTFVGLRAYKWLRQRPPRGDS
jgi:hypothetical protein